LRTALDSISVPYPLVATPESPFLANANAALSAALAAEGVEPDDFVTSTGDERHAASLRYVIWLLAEHSIYQTSIVYRTANTLVLLGLKSFQNLEAQPDRTDRLFREQLGLEAYEYVRLLVGLWSQARRQSLVDTRTFLPPDLRDSEKRSRLIAVVDELSLKFDQYRDPSVFPAAAQYTGRARACAFFSRWPLIRLNEDQYVAAAPPFLKIQIATKSVTKALFLARSREGSGSTEYSGWLGRRLERFFAELCDLWRPGGHFGEYEYLRSGNDKSPDRIVFETHGTKRVCCLFQLKLKMLSEATHFGASSETMQKDFASAFAETIYKTIRFLAKATTAAASGGLRDESAQLTRQIVTSDRFCLVGVVPDMPSIFNISDVRKWLMVEVLAHLTPQERHWFDRNFRRCIWHILDLDEFEWFLSIQPRHRELYKRLSGYIREAAVDAPFTLGGTIPASFLSYLVNRYGEWDAERSHRRLTSYLPELFALFNEMTADVLNYFGFHRPSADRVST
jgi:hypothetical protein